MPHRCSAEGGLSQYCVKIVRGRAALRFREDVEVHHIDRIITAALLFIAAVALGVILYNDLSGRSPKPRASRLLLIFAIVALLIASAGMFSLAAAP